MDESSDTWKLAAVCCSSRLGQTPPERKELPRSVKSFHSKEGRAPPLNGFRWRIEERLEPNLGREALACKGCHDCAGHKLLISMLVDLDPTVQLEARKRFLREARAAPRLPHTKLYPPRGCVSHAIGAEEIQIESAFCAANSRDRHVALGAGRSATPRAFGTISQQTASSI
jgi:hypothetical protein